MRATSRLIACGAVVVVALAGTAALIRQGSQSPQSRVEPPNDRTASARVVARGTIDDTIWRLVVTSKPKPCVRVVTGRGSLGSCRFLLRDSVFHLREGSIPGIFGEIVYGIADSTLIARGKSTELVASLAGEEKEIPLTVVPSKGDISYVIGFLPRIAPGTVLAKAGNRMLQAQTLQLAERRLSRKPVASFLQDALAIMRRNLDIPVALPPLPKGSRLPPRKGLTAHFSGAKKSYRLHLLVGRRRHLYIDYGVAVFDGCGGDQARPVNVGIERGLLLGSHRTPWSQLIWPANKRTLRGTYGLAGSFTGKELLKLARSMQTRLEAQPSPHGHPNC